LTAQAFKKKAASGPRGGRTEATFRLIWLAIKTVPQSARVVVIGLVSSLARTDAWCVLHDSICFSRFNLLYDQLKFLAASKTPRDKGLARDIGIVLLLPGAFLCPRQMFCSEASCRDGLSARRRFISGYVGSNRRPHADCFLDLRRIGRAIFRTPAQGQILARPHRRTVFAADLRRKTIWREEG